MTTIFISGSRHLLTLPKAVTTRIDTIVQKGFNIVVGDANGADKMVQTYLAQQGATLVTVYCAGGVCRNNVGQWQQHYSTVGSHLKGRAFYTVKDKAMALEADYGLILWDGKSQGSLNNAIELVSQNKPAVVWHHPQQRFISVRSSIELSELQGISKQTSLAF